MSCASAEQLMTKGKWRASKACSVLNIELGGTADAARMVYEAWEITKRENRLRWTEFVGPLQLPDLASSNLACSALLMCYQA